MSLQPCLPGHVIKYPTNDASATDENDPNQPPTERVISLHNSEYYLEFPKIYWRKPQDHPVEVSSFVDDDRVSLASTEATYGGDRETIYMFDEDERLERREMFRRRREDVARVRD